MKLALLLICIVIASAATASAQATQSVYTDLGGKKCRVIEKDAEAAGYLLEQCPGIAGYQLQVASGDDRQNIIVIKSDGSKHELNFGQIGGGGFSNVGAKAEWRVRRQQGKLMPVALIVRFDVTTGGDGKSVSYLTVTKITPQKICLIDPIAPGPNQNEKARRLADDSANKPCFDPLGTGQQ
jgi:opacity protein-like surface antigen